jgi:hypothetical protein
MNYRKIWKDANGPIPIDEFGRTYEIHHIDGNKKNNDLSNLMCVSLKEHYNIHYQQKDWPACNLLAHRLYISTEEQIELNKKLSGENHPSKRPEVREKIKNNHANFKKENHPGWGKKNIGVSEWNKKQNRSGKNNGMYGKGYLISGEKHGMFGKSHSEEAIKKMKVPKTEEHKLKLSKPKMKIECEICKKLVDKADMKRWHGINKCYT